MNLVIKLSPPKLTQLRSQIHSKVLIVRHHLLVKLDDQCRPDSHDSLVQNRCDGRVQYLTHILHYDRLSFSQTLLHYLQIFRLAKVNHLISNIKCIIMRPDVSHSFYQISCLVIHDIYLLKTTAIFECLVPDSPDSSIVGFLFRRLLVSSRILSYKISKIKKELIQ